MFNFFFFLSHAIMSNPTVTAIFTLIAGKHAAHSNSRVSLYRDHYMLFMQFRDDQNEPNSSQTFKVNNRKKENKRGPF